MWRKKKFIIIAALAVLLLGASLGGVAIAQANDEPQSQPQTGNLTFLERVAQIYEKNTGIAIDPDELKKAINEARQQLKDEALDRYLDKLVAQGKITEEQANEFKEWLNSKPAFPTEEFREWWQSRPDIPGLFGPKNQLRPFGGMHRGFGKFGGRFGFGGWCRP